MKYSKHWTPLEYGEIANRNNNSSLFFREYIRRWIGQDVFIDTPRSNVITFELFSIFIDFYLVDMLVKLNGQWKLLHPFGEDDAVIKTAIVDLNPYIDKAISFRSKEELLEHCPHREELEATFLQWSNGN
jgi:hypothetical protein